MMRKEVSKLFLPGKALILILLGSITWILTMVKSGVIYSYGMGFWGANGHDGVWHVALINSLARGSYDMPVFAGELLKNYHIGFDLGVALINRITSIPTVTLYFQILPVVLALGVGISAFWFIYEWSASSKAALIGTFFVYFGGDLAWIFNHGESTFWAQQAVSTLINPPFALSLIFIFLGLVGLVKYAHGKSKYFLGFTVLFFGLLAGVKIYAAILVLCALFGISIFELIRERKSNLFMVFLATFLVSLFIFIPLNKNAGSLVVFQPFWFLETLFAPDRFSVPRLYSAIMNYRLAKSVKIIPGFLIAFFVFWIGNMGTRLVKEYQVIKWLKNFKKVNSLDVFVTLMIIGGAAIPMLFLQKGTPWNTIQFFYYSLVFSGVLAGIALQNSRRMVITFIVLITIPTTIITLKNNYLPSRPPARISNTELEALNFLSKQPQGVVLTYPFDKEKANAAIPNPPRPLYLYDSTAYVSAFGNHPVFLEDEVNLNITDFPWRDRRAQVEEFFAQGNSDFLKKNNISYIYLLKGQKLRLNLRRIFENLDVGIYIVD